MDSDNFLRQLISINNREELKLNTLQILIPGNSRDLNTINRVTISKNAEKYNAIVDAFIGDQIDHSLYFLKLRSIYKYQELTKAHLVAKNGFQISSDQFSIGKGKRNQLEGLNLIETWNRWIASFEEGSFGQSLFWCQSNVDLHIVSKRFKMGDQFTASAFAVMDGPISKEKRDYLKSYIDGLIISLTIRLFYNDLRQQTVETSVTRILARNFSHHIGSHVAIRSSIGVLEGEVKALIKPRLIDEIRDLIIPRLQKILNKTGLDEQKKQARLQQLNEIEDLIQRDPDLISEKNFNKLIVHSASTYDQYEKYKRVITEQKQRLDNYEIIRNEYLAEPNSNLKSFQFFSQVLKPFVENTLLMRFIGYSEGYTNDENTEGFKITAKRNGRIVKLKYPGDNTFYLTQNTLNQGYYAFETDESKLDDLVAISNPHAFYSILENIIRNTVKHNRKAKHCFELCIDMRDKSESMYEVLITDNLSDGKGKLKDIRRRFEVKVLDEYSQPQRQNNGILDIKISANLLKGRQDFQFEVENHPVTVNCNDETSHLEYLFEVPKALEIGYIGNEDLILQSYEKAYEGWEGFRKQYATYKLAPRFLIATNVTEDQRDIKKYAQLSTHLHKVNIGRMMNEAHSLEERKKYLYDEYFEMKNISGTYVFCKLQTEENVVKLSNRIEMEVLDRRLPNDLQELNHINLIDHHGEGLKSAIRKGIDFDYSKLSYLLLDKNVKSFNEFHDMENKLFFLEVLSALNASVLIIDERIAEKATYDKCAEALGLETVFDLSVVANVYLATKFTVSDGLILDQADFLSVDLSKSGIKVESKNSFANPRNLDYFDFIIIHRTIYLAALKQNPSTANLLSTLGDKLIIDSGSGNLNGINEEIFYMPFTTLNECISNRLDKLNLYRACLSAELKMMSP